MCLVNAASLWCGSSLAPDRRNLVAAYCGGLARPVATGLRIDERTNSQLNELALELRELVRQALMPSRDRISAQPLASQPEVLR